MGKEKKKLTDGVAHENFVNTKWPEESFGMANQPKDTVLDLLTLLRLILPMERGQADEMEEETRNWSIVDDWRQGPF